MKSTTLAREFIGTHVQIIDSTNKSLVGLEGVILDETKQTFTIKTDKGQKTVLKSGITFELPNGEVIQGVRLIKRPEQRLKG